MTVMRFEDFVDRPTQEIANVLTFIGMGNGRAAELSAFVNRPDTLGRWRGELAPEMISKMHMLGEHVLRKFDYECTTGGV